MSQLREAVDALVAVATEAGLPPDRARDEAMVFAAAIAEAAPRAAQDWCAAIEGAPTELAAVNAAFFDAASRGRKSRGAPTALLSELAATAPGRATAYAKALTEVASAACSSANRRCGSRAMPPSPPPPNWRPPAWPTPARPPGACPQASPVCRPPPPPSGTGSGPPRR